MKFRQKRNDKTLFAAYVGMIVLFNPAICGAHPLDGYGFTGIARLEVCCLAMDGKVRAQQSLAPLIHHMLEKHYRVGKFSSGPSQAGKPAHQAPQ